jgi:BlaI family penicillinase repressor
MPKTNKPTESELEILQVLWNKQPASVREVHEKLAKVKTTGYTTTLKLMQIMFEKQLVTRNSSYKAHTYQTALSRETAQELFVSKMIDSLFAGSPTELVKQVLEKKTSPEQLNEIRAYLGNL